MPYAKGFVTRRYVPVLRPIQGTPLCLADLLPQLTYVTQTPVDQMPFVSQDLTRELERRDPYASVMKVIQEMELEVVLVGIVFHFNIINVLIIEPAMILRV